MKYEMVHTCIRVMDINKSLEFYEKVLGFKEERRMDFPEQKFTLVFLGDEISNYLIELTYNYNQDKAYEIGNGFSHIGVVVDDFEESYKKHKEMDCEISDLKGLPGQPPKFYFITDPDGYSIEIIRKK